MGFGEAAGVVLFYLNIQCFTSMWDQELCSVILVSPFQLKVSHGSMTSGIDFSISCKILQLERGNTPQEEGGSSIIYINNLAEE